MLFLRRECGGRMSKHMEFYIQDDAASIQIGKNVYRCVSIPIDDFNAACDHYGFVKERTCHDANTRFNAWTCSECKCTQLLMFDDYGEPTLSIDGVASVPKYCPNCGAKVTPKYSETTPKVVGE